jgi:CRISPR-associated exonuclease Cas4
LDVSFDETLRKTTKEAAIHLHKFVEAGKTPAPVYSPKCDSCSFIDICMPKQIEHNLSVIQYLEREAKEQ